MIRLSNTTQKLQISLSSAMTTANMPVIVNYSDKTSTDYEGSTQLSNTNGTSQVDICDAPAASAIRDIDHVQVRNADSLAKLVRIRLDNNGTDYIITEVTLEVGETLEYTHGEGWKVFDGAGQIKYTVSSGGAETDPVWTAAEPNYATKNFAIAMALALG